jgi:hypothetical protein
VVLIHVNESGYRKSEPLALDKFFICREAIFTEGCEFFNNRTEKPEDLLWCKNFKKSLKHKKKLGIPRLQIGVTAQSDCYPEDGEICGD